MPTPATDVQLEALRELIERIARGEVSEEEGRRLFEDAWARSAAEPLFRKILRELLPSLARGGVDPNRDPVTQRR